MQSLNPNGFKVRSSSILRKKKTLVREIETFWNNSIPKQARWPTCWLVLASLVDDLSERLPESLINDLKKVIDNRDFPAYLKLGTVYGSPQMYDYPGSYFASTTVLNLLKKTLLKTEGLDPLTAAIDRFEDAERRCLITNKRLRHYRQFSYSSSRPLTKKVEAAEIFHLAQLKIKNWIGCSVPKDIFSDVRHGPGGCVGLKRPRTTPYYKFASGDYTVSEGAYWHAIRTIASNEAWVRGLALEQGLIDTGHSIECIPYESKVRLIDNRVKIANYNEVTFVDKNAKTKRAIAIEPRLNVALQLSVGAFLKKALKRAGCDLSDQSRNQQLAFVGSIQHDQFDPVTIDLEMASDTMSLELVRELLPIEWFEFLEDLRSPSGLHGKQVRQWEKFSSMGNGYTFELESMIFYALAQACSDLTATSEWFSNTFGPAYKYAYVSVFGDDIIVPSRVAPMLVSILRFAGFRTNEEKSFLSGLFRESCGKDYFAGVPVRTFYFERDLSRLCDIVHLHNGLKLLSESHIKLPVHKTLELVRGLLPKSISTHLVGVRPTIGDEYLWTDPDLCHRSKLVTWDRDHQNWIFPLIRRKAVQRRGSNHWRYVQFLYSNTDRFSRQRDGIDRFPDDLSLHVSAGGSSGDVVLSGGGLGKLSYQG